MIYTVAGGFPGQRGTAGTGSRKGDRPAFNAPASRAALKAGLSRRSSIRRDAAARRQTPAQRKRGSPRTQLRTDVAAVGLQRVRRKSVSCPSRVPPDTGRDMLFAPARTASEGGMVCLQTVQPAHLRQHLVAHRYGAPRPLTGLRPVVNGIRLAGYSCEIDPEDRTAFPF